MGVRNILVDDIDGTEASNDSPVVSIPFSIEGKAYRIDLNEKNREALYKALNPFIEVARRDNGAIRAPRAGKGGSGRSDLNEVRVWAKENGFEVSERGRIASAVLDAYDAAH